MNKKKILLISIMIMILIVVVFIKNIMIKDEKYEQLTFDDVTVTQKQDEAKAITEPETIKVHITGEINHPGLIELEVGSRIDDAIERAGGLTSQADTSKTNLVYILSDGEKIYIPNINDEETLEELNNQSSNRKININTATIADLKTIPGVGDSTANAIIEYRTKNRKVYYNRRYPECFWNRAK